MLPAIGKRCNPAFRPEFPITDYRSLMTSPAPPFQQFRFPPSPCHVRPLPQIQGVFARTDSAFHFRCFGARLRDLARMVQAAAAEGAGAEAAEPAPKEMGGKRGAARQSASLGFPRCSYQAKMRTRSPPCQRLRSNVTRVTLRSIHGRRHYQGA